MAHPDKPWDWWAVSENPNITWDIVTTNPDEPWNWGGLCLNPSITWGNVLANPDKPWDWSILSWRQDITWDIVATNLTKPWSWGHLSHSLDVLVPENHIRGSYAATVIQRYWRRCISDPKYLMCQRRLLREFENM